MADNSSVDVTDAEMERHLKRAIDKEEAKVDSKKTKTVEEALPEISIDEAPIAEEVKKVDTVMKSLDSFSRLQINQDLREERGLMMKLATKDNNSLRAKASK